MLLLSLYDHSYSLHTNVTIKIAICLNMPCKHNTHCKICLTYIAVFEAHHSYHILYCSRIEKILREQRTDKETNYRGHSNPQWIVGLSEPIALILSWPKYIFFGGTVEHSLGECGVQCGLR